MQNATLKKNVGDSIYLVKKSVVGIPGPGSVAVGRTEASSDGFDGYAHLKPAVSEVTKE